MNSLKTKLLIGAVAIIAVVGVASSQTRTQSTSQTQNATTTIAPEAAQPSTTPQVRVVQVSSFYNGSAGYSLSIPTGNKSTCVWTYAGGNADVPYTQTTSANTATEKHAISATDGFYDFKVTCVDDFGNQYTGVFPPLTYGSSATQQQTAPAPIIFSTTLSSGSSGTVVANVQQFLADEGLYAGRDTGIFDQSTTDAIIAFEQQENIALASGIWGLTEQAHANTIIASHPDWVTTLSNNNEYSNVNGSPVHSPSYSSNGVPAGATAVCGDGTYSFSMHRSGTCSHHGGVSQWLQ